MSIKIQRYIAILSVVLFIGKLIAWQLTHSVTILTDALESIVNVVAGFLGLFSISIAARPRDTNHPYGHGKAELLSAAVEGTLIILSGIVIVYEAILHIVKPAQLEQLNIGLAIIAVAGLINYLAGRYAVQKGMQSNSLVLLSAGKHLQTDAYSTVAIIIGLTLMILTHNHWPWMDSLVGFAFAMITMLTGYKILRKSISGIMDEMDMVLLKNVIDVLQDKRQPQWVDLHNLRVIQYGSLMHVDAHMTLPWYFQVADADREIHMLESLIKKHFSEQVELFIHIDGCMSYQCKLCAMPDCKVRKEPYQQQLQWNIDNVWADSKHGKTATEKAR